MYILFIFAKAVFVGWDFPSGYLDLIHLSFEIFLRLNVPRGKTHFLPLIPDTLFPDPVVVYFLKPNFLQRYFVSFIENCFTYSEVSKNQPPLLPASFPWVPIIRLITIDILVHHVIICSVFIFCNFFLRLTLVPCGGFFFKS